VESVYNLMPEDEVILENVLLGLDAEYQDSEMDIDEDMDENSDEDVNDDDEDYDENW
jgi:hypothetical protein